MNSTEFTKCSVIIPVYNGFSESLACLESVLKYSKEVDRILVIDDCSPKGHFADFLPKKVKASLKLELLRNAYNLGFVKTCNLGMILSAPHDIVLLNSDTLVTENWLLKLKAAAYKNDRHGTVTPLSNNGSATSTPLFEGRDEIPPGYSLDEFAELVEKVSERDYPILPTGVGFCMYIKREVIDKIGILDEENFSKGYGEENDFSCRAQKAGYLDITADDTFIYHKGSVSFKESKIPLIERNTRILNKKHPHYENSVMQFWRNFPLVKTHVRILDEMIRRWNEKKKAGRILHIVHNGPFQAREHRLGGTEFHVQDLINNCSNFSHWSLTQYKDRFFLTAHAPGVNREYSFPANYDKLLEITSRENFHLLHLHHFKNFNYQHLSEALMEHGNFIFSAHDYFSVCPQITLLKPDYTHCNGFECVEACGFEKGEVSNLRDTTCNFLSAAKAVITFSSSTREYLTRLTNKSFNWKLIPHGIEKISALNVLPENVLSDRRQLPEKIKVLFLGAIGMHKGAKLIREIITETQLPNGMEIEWSLLGEIHCLGVSDFPNLIQYGRYKREECSQKINEISPHITAILTVCPETYCLTLDESWDAGIPVISTPLGAPAERIKESGAGWVLPELTKESFMETLNSIASDYESYKAVRNKISSAKLTTTKDTSKKYEELYSELCEERDGAVLESTELILKSGGIINPARLSFVKNSICSRASATLALAK